MTELLTGIEQFEPRRWIRPGDTVVWGQAAAEPVALTKMLMRERATIGSFRCFFAMGISGIVRPEHADLVSFVSYTAAGSNRHLAEAGVLDILPVHYSDYPRFFASRRLPCDVVLLQVAPADAAGRHSIGVADEYLSSALDAARVVIAEVNDQLPRTNGRMLARDELDVIVPTSHRPPTIDTPAGGETERRIGEHVAGLIEDGSTLQTGIGSLPDAILAALAGHADLGVHTGLLGDRMVDLIEAGVITNARKSVDAGVSIAAVLSGSDQVLKFADGNPALRLCDTGYTHDPTRLARQARMVAINSAFEVDLTGQVNAEVAGGSYIGAVGGAMDFLRGAARSEGGLPIIALASTKGDRSRIVGKLGGPVSTPRADAGVIVTEHGFADLRGRSVAERRRLMLGLVDPRHQAAAEAEAEAMPDVVTGRSPAGE